MLLFFSLKKNLLQCYQNFLEIKRMMQRLMMNKRLFIHKRGFSWASMRGRKGEKKNKQEENQESNQYYLPRSNQLFMMYIGQSSLFHSVQWGSDWSSD